MRRTGKTTRMVDAAVQALFAYERIIVPNLRDNSSPTDGYDLNQIFIDPDATYENGAQKYLTERIMDRIEREHNHLKVTRTRNGGLRLLSKQF